MGLQRVGHDWATELIPVCVSSVQFIHSVVSDSLWSHESQHARPPCPSPTPGVHSHSLIESVMPSSYLILCHPLLFLPSIFPSGLFASGGQSIGASTSASVLPMTMQVRFPLGLTFLISLLSQGLSRVFSNITVQRHHFFSTQPFSLSSSHIHIWLLEKP